jgi:hypothetical protein
MFPDNCRNSHDIISNLCHQITTPPGFSRPQPIVNQITPGFSRPQPIVNQITPPPGFFRSSMSSQLDVFCQESRSLKNDFDFDFDMKKCGQLFDTPDEFKMCDHIGICKYGKNCNNLHIDNHDERVRVLEVRKKKLLKNQRYIK